MLHKGNTVRVNEVFKRKYSKTVFQLIYTYINNVYTVYCSMYYSLPEMHH